MSTKINIAITGTGSLIGQAIIKSIQKSVLVDRFELIGFDYIPNTVGSYWCKYNYLLPDIFKKNETEESWLTFLLEKIKEYNIQILFIGIDFELPIFAKNKAYIESLTNCKIIVSDNRVIDIADDKYLTYQFLKGNNLYYPLSYTKEEYKKGTLDYPLIIKPRIGARSIGFNLIKNEEQFNKVISTVENPVIQECVGTSETEYTCGVLFLDNELKGMIALKRTLKEGNTYSSEYNKEIPTIIYDYLEKITLALKPYGSCNFQLRLDKDGKPKLFEINARHSGTTYIRTFFGYNEVEYILCYYLNLPLNSLTNLKEGKVIRYFDEFFVEA